MLQEQAKTLSNSQQFFFKVKTETETNNKAVVINKIKLKVSNVTYTAQTKKYIHKQCNYQVNRIYNRKLRASVFGKHSPEQYHSFESSVTHQKKSNNGNCIQNFSLFIVNNQYN